MTSGSARYTKVYNSLPLLPEDLDIIIIRLANYHQDPNMQKFRKDFMVRKKVVKRWLTFLWQNHEAYRDIDIADDNLNALPNDAFVDNEMIIHQLSNDDVAGSQEMDVDEDVKDNGLAEDD
jgi:hypothetical protein